MHTHRDVDLSDPRLYIDDDGIQMLAELQSDTALYWNTTNNGFGFWVVLRYEEAVAVLGDPETFSSAQGMAAGQDDAAARAAADRMLIVSDDPRHAGLRKIIGPGLAPRTIEELVDPMREIVAEAISGAIEAQPIDFVDRVATPLPASVISTLMGIPQTDWSLMTELSRTAFRSTSEDADVTREEAIVANAEIFDYFTELAERRRSMPSDDLVTRLVRGTIDDEPLSSLDVTLNINGLITGGNETTRHAATGAALAFADHPEEYEKLRASPELVGSATEEILRWTATSLNVMRTARRDATVGGQLVRSGERIAIWNPIVNRDPRQFPEPQRFRVDRSPNRHLTLGYGMHHCVGGHLARLELRVLLEEMLKRVGRIDRAGPVKRLRSNLMWGIDRAPVILHPLDSKDAQ